VLRSERRLVAVSARGLTRLGGGLPAGATPGVQQLRLWGDQLVELVRLRRSLNRQRRRAGERITTNKLIRVAVALLLSRSQDLSGTTEEELRRSLGLPELQTPDLRSLRVELA
jgi:hypothetical protein